MALCWIPSISESLGNKNKNNLKSLYESSLNCVVNNFNGTNDLLLKLPSSILLSLIDNLNVFDLFSFEAFILNSDTFNKCVILSYLNSIWKVHFHTLWNFYNEDLNFNLLEQSIGYKSLYFEHLFNETKAFQLDLSVLLNNGKFENVLDLSMTKIHKYNITKTNLVLRMRSTIQMSPETKKFLNIQSWQSEWNSSLKKLYLVPNTWQIIKQEPSLMDLFKSNIKSVVLISYPLINNIDALKFVISLLLYGKVDSIVLKYPPKFLLKLLIDMFENEGQSSMFISKGFLRKYSDSVVCLNKISETKTFEIEPEKLCQLSKCTSQTNSSRFKKRKNFKKSKSYLSLGTSESFASKDIFSTNLLDIFVPKLNNLYFIKSLDICYLNAKIRIDLLVRLISEIKNLENLSLSNIGTYSFNLERCLISLCFKNRLKHLTLSNIKLSNGANGFLSDILSVSTSDLNLVKLKLDLIKSKNFKFLNDFAQKSAIRQTNLQSFEWTEKEFSIEDTRILDILIKQSRNLKILNLVSCQMSSNLRPSDHSTGLKFISTNLKELRLKSFKLDENQTDILFDLIGADLLNLERLELENMDLNPNLKQNEKLFKMLENLKKLKFLSFHSNFINDLSFQRLVDSIENLVLDNRKHIVLESLNLSKNQLTQASFDYCLKSFSRLNQFSTFRLKFLNLAQNLFSYQKNLEYKDLLKEYANIISI